MRNPIIVYLKLSTTRIDFPMNHFDLNVKTQLLGMKKSNTSRCDLCMVPLLMGL